MNLKELKLKEGENVEYLYRGKYRLFKLIAVQTEEEIMIRDSLHYRGNIGDFRLNYVDNKPREWAGFWTNKIDRIRLI